MSGRIFISGRKRKNLRRYLLEEKNLLDGIFLLPDALWKPGFPETVLLCFRKGRTEESPVYLLDGSGEEVSGMAELTDCFLHRKEKDNLACLITKEQIKAQGMNLNPARYFEAGSGESIGLTDIEAVKKRLVEIDARLHAIEEQRKIYTLELDFLMPSD